MISEVHAGGVNSAAHATEKETNLVAPKKIESANREEQPPIKKSSPSTIVSLGNGATAELLTYSKQSILANAVTQQYSASDLAPLDEPNQPLAAPEVTTSAFGGTKKPPP